MKLQYLSKKNVKEIASRLEKAELDEEIVNIVRNCSKAYFVEYPRFKIYVFDGIPLLFEHIKIPETLLPTLYFVNTFINSRGKPPMHWVRVDEGAINPILRGADVMIPGIKEHSMFTKGSPVCVLEPNKRYAIAIGISLISAHDLEQLKRGKGIKVVSRLNDDLWSACLEIARKSR